MVLIYVELLLLCLRAEANYCKHNKRVLAVWEQHVPNIAWQLPKIEWVGE